MATPTPQDSGIGGGAVMAVSPELRFLLRSRLRRESEIRLRLDGTSTVLHHAESLGIPRTEIGRFSIAGRDVAAGHVPCAGERVEVAPIRRPQRGTREGFLLDVGLGSLARALRVLGIDARYRNDADDAALVAEAIRTGRVLLTQDRGLLHRRALPRGALVRGQGRDSQVHDVLTRFAPELRPWTRCPGCNGGLRAVDRREVVRQLGAGTRRSYVQFARCAACGKVYWHGAHAAHLDQLVDDARATVAMARGVAP